MKLPNGKYGKLLHFIGRHFPSMIGKAFQFLFCMLVLVGPPASAAGSADSVFLEELTWTELKAQIAAGKTTVIVPIGGTEQNGPYMALGKHNVRVKMLSEKIARSLGNAIVAPVIAYVPEGTITPPTAHMRFPGTITVSDQVFESMLASAARSFKLHGFRDVVFLGDHGGYRADLKLVAEHLNREWMGTPVRVHDLPEYYQSTQNEYVQSLKSDGYGANEIGTHAGLADTSLMLALAPQMVRADALRSAAKPSAEQGIYGDPRKASAELGRAGVDAVVSKTVEAIKKATARN
jgi:creatinine amidohydrolase